MDEGAPEGGRAEPEPSRNRAAAWVSQGFEELLYKLANAREVDAKKAPVDYDVVIVGSGYGGAIAAAGLAGCRENDGGRTISVCVLERGKEYLPGMFPSRMAELPGHVRFSTPASAKPRGTREGLFDVRVGPDICAMVANGLGGGSLINAGVMEEPGDEVFADKRWPEEFRDRAKRSALYERARALLGAIGNTIELHPEPPAKFEALRRLAGGSPFRAASITVAMADKHNAAGVALKQCTLCGDCATGCNHGAKDSLDVNLLVQASRRGAEIYTGATVLRIARDRDSADVWVLTVVHTDEKLRKRQGGSRELRARKVILAAGTFGSAEILLRSRSDTLEFSRWLGQRFSSNGDMIAVAYGQHMPVNAVANESAAPRLRRVGPTITGIVDLRGEANDRFVIEELAIPAPLRRAFEEIVTTSSALHELGTADPGDHGPTQPQHDPCAVDAAAIGRTSVFAVMGRDRAEGSLELVGGAGEDDGDGAVRVRWPELRDEPLFRRQIERLKELVRDSGTGGEVLPHPLWQLLPEDMQTLLGNRRGPPLTVHPLGGCTMGEDSSDGVVDRLGRVFDAAPSAGPSDVLNGLAVLDGSIVPASLGINPALTISALACNSVQELRAQWEFVAPPDAGPEKEVRPVFREVPEPETPRPTEVEIIERMSGRAVLTGEDGGAVSCAVELTLRFKRLPLADLVLPLAGQSVPMPRRLVVRQGELRVFEEGKWRSWRRRGEPQRWTEDGRETTVDDIVELRAPLVGTLTFLHREESSRFKRIAVALHAWLLNRGLRDLWQMALDRRREKGWGGLRKTFFGRGSPEGGPSLREWIRRLFALASRAGEVRLLEYRLSLGPASHTGSLLRASDFEGGGSREIRGLKRLTYGRRSNPWRQLSQMALVSFPGLRVEESALARGWAWIREILGVPPAKRRPVLDLDTKFLAREGVPLLRIVGQQDQPSALADVASFLAYFVRLLLNIHVWSFRKPDAPVPREPRRLPGAVEGLPPPFIKELDVDRLRDGSPVRARLTRYRASDAEGRPVVLIHGYSASGTTFAHHAVRPNLAEHFCRRKRDVWILDLRTSSGMPTARHPWTFEDAALVDLPAAFEYIRGETGQMLDVFAHCMGAAMLGMAVLKPPEPGERLFRQRQALPAWIHKAVLSQIGPAVVMSPDNIFRAYVMSYLRHFLPFAGYDFRVRPDAGLMDQLIDRLLATLPYPEEEFDIENPPWRPCRRTPFAGTRHRMDALYGRDFSLADKDGKALLDDKVLEYIDDLFGPLSIDTVSQAIQFARLQVIATREGRNEYVSRTNLQKRWVFPTLSIHGQENGLSDVATLERMSRILRDDAGCDFRTHAFEGFGHQDSLIGKRAGEVFQVVSEFLS